VEDFKALHSMNLEASNPEIARDPPPLLKLQNKATRLQERTTKSKSLARRVFISKRLDQILRSLFSDMSRKGFRSYQHKKDTSHVEAK
jgi:hypothetical protein